VARGGGCRRGRHGEGLRALGPFMAAPSSCPIVLFVREESTEEEEREEKREKKRRREEKNGEIFWT
jgi:hypothetical protein